MSLSRRVSIPIIALCVACSPARELGPGDLAPPLEIQGAGVVEPRLDARLQLPVSVVDGLVVTRLIIRNALSEPVSSGACTLASDARTLSGGEWRNVSPAEQGCTRQLITALPEGSMSLSVVVDRALLRAVAGGAGRTAVVRTRHLVSGATVNYTVQSAEQQVTAP